MQVNLSGDYPIDQLEDYAEILQERIEDIEQINEAEIRGVNAKEMEVEVDHLRAEAMLVSFNDIAPSHWSGKPVDLGGRHPHGWPQAHRAGRGRLPWTPKTWRPSSSRAEGGTPRLPCAM